MVGDHGVGAAVDSLLDEAAGGVEADEHGAHLAFPVTDEEADIVPRFGQGQGCETVDAPENILYSYRHILSMDTLCGKQKKVHSRGMYLSLRFAEAGVSCPQRRLWPRGANPAPRGMMNVDSFKELGVFVVRNKGDTWWAQ